MSSENERSCKYGREEEITYYDKFGAEIRYECPHKAVKDGYCIFHHPKYWKENPDEVRKKFYEEIKSFVNSNQDIVCIGYNLPEIRIRDTDIDKFEYVNFNYCKFYGTVEFSHTIFEEAYFQNAKFEAADFSNSKFVFADFSGSEFKSAHFVRTIFYTSLFDDVIFEEALFIGSLFREALFYESKFKQAYFIRTKFESGIFQRSVFEYVEFRDFLAPYLDFSQAIFEDVAVFKKGDFRETTKTNTVQIDPTIKTEGWMLDEYWEALQQDIEEKASKSDPVIIFHLAKFKNQSSVTFIEVPLSNLCFLMTDVSGILLVCDSKNIKKDGILSEKFLRVKERVLKKEVNADDKKEIKEVLRKHYPHITSENALWNLCELFSYTTKETVLAEYRNIRKSFEKNRTFAEASELFIREMRMLRENLSLPEKIVHWAYDGISRYGESFLRPLLILVGAIFTLPIVSNLSSGLPTFENYWADVENTTRLFFQLPVEHKYGAWEIAIRLLSIILLGNMFIAFRRRLERR